MAPPQRQGHQGFTREDTTWQLVLRIPQYPAFELELLDTAPQGETNPRIHRLYKHGMAETLLLKWVGGSPEGPDLRSLMEDEGPVDEVGGEVVAPRPSPAASTEEVEARGGGSEVPPSPREEGRRDDVFHGEEGEDVEEQRVRQGAKQVDGGGKLAAQPLPAVAGLSGMPLHYVAVAIHQAN